jgi:hypothetical protein
MIPKIIHYCWFGGNPMPETDASYVSGWKKLLPDYKFILWNEDNFDINSTLFTKQVAEAKKYGFIVDYIRAWAVYNFGGIYLDTDVELIKPLDDLLNNICFGGFEYPEYSGFKNMFIAPGLIFAAEKGSAIAREIMDFYSKYSFIKEDGSYDFTPSPKIFTRILLRYGLKPDGSYQILKDGIFTAYPVEYFCPIDYRTKIATVTHNTYSVHHYNASWLSKSQKRYARIKNIMTKIFGEEKGRIFSYPFYIICRIKEIGVKSALKKVIKKLK